MHILTATLLLPIAQALTPNPCPAFSPAPIPISALPPFFPAPNPTTATLLASESIRQTLSLYAYTIDARSYNTLSSIFTPDATANYSAPLGVLQGVDTIAATLGASLAQFAGTQHQLGSVSVRVCDARTALSATYFRAVHFFPRNGTVQVPDIAGYASVLYAYGQYQDSWVRREEGWRIAYRNLVYMGPLITELG